jgi:hypothetical protein
LGSGERGEGEGDWKTDLGYLEDGSMALSIGVIHKFQPPGVLVRTVFPPFIQKNGSIRFRNKASPDVEKGVGRIEGPLQLVLFRSKGRNLFDRVLDETSQESPRPILSKVAVKAEVEPNTIRIHFENLLEVTIDDSG